MGTESRFERVRLLGRGSFGEVHLARDRVSGQEVALKTLSITGEALAEAFARFRREARIQARLRNPYLVKVIDTDLEGDPAWIAMEYVAGRDLAAELARSGPLPVDRVERLARQLAEAVDALHLEGVLHRDLKPGNVMIRAPGQDAVVMDLGLACVQGATILTQTGQLMGTPAYIPPEALRDGTWTRSGDLFQLGAILFEAATGRRLVPGADLTKVLENLQEGRFEAVPEHLALPPRLAGAIRMASAWDPAQRLASGRALVDVLDGAAEVDGRLAASSLAMGRKARSRSPTPAAGGARPRGPALLAPGLALAALAGAGLLAARFLGGAPPPRDLRWSVLGDTLLVEYADGRGDERLVLPGLEVAPETGADGRHRVVYRGLLPGMSLTAKLAWAGGESFPYQARASLPAVEVTGPAGTGELDLVVRRPCRARLGPDPGPWAPLDPGPGRLPVPAGPGPWSLEVEEQGVLTQTALEPAAVASRGFDHAMAGLAGVDPRRELVGAGARSFAGLRQEMGKLGPWLPTLLADPATARARLESWFLIQLTAPLEKLLERSVEDLEAPPWSPGWRGPPGPGRPGSVTATAEAHPLDGLAPTNPARPGQIMMVARATKAQWTLGKWVDGATRARFLWPPEAPDDGRTVCLTLGWGRLPAKLGLRVDPLAKDRLPIDFWDPGAARNIASFSKGGQTVCFPARLGPRPGSSPEIETLPMSEVAADYTYLSVEVTVSWPPTP